MPTPTDDFLLALASTLAERAAGVILEIRSRGFSVDTKPDRTPVTEADRQSERLIVAGLRESCPDIPVVAEEEASAGASSIQRDGTFWLVDPLDGTREFAAGHDSFCVNIGLVRDRRPVLGVVAVPVEGALYAGRVGHGAFRTDRDGRKALHTRAVPTEGMWVLASRRSGEPRIADLLREPGVAAALEGQTVAAVERLGSAVKFVRIAAGLADLHVRNGRTMEWDTAAPQAVLEAAGGVVRTTDGAALGYGKPGYENPSFVCRGRA